VARSAALPNLQIEEIDSHFRIDRMGATMGKFTECIPLDGISAVKRAGERLLR
jgi:hypothetical protein